MGGQGEEHECMIPLKRVEGVELSEALPEGLIGQLIWRVLDEVQWRQHGPEKRHSSKTW